jgi:outer membrane immunogenic protein
MDGGGIGGHLGFNILSGNWLAGLEADATWLDASGARGFAGPARLNAHVDWVTSFRGRIGYVFGDALLYATGGAAAAGLQARFDAPAAASWSNDVPLGYVIGGGIEMRLGADWSGRIEALHFGFDDRSLSFATGRMPADLDVTTVRAGLTFQFR